MVPQNRGKIPPHLGDLTKLDGGWGSIFFAHAQFFIFLFFQFFRKIDKNQAFSAKIRVHFPWEFPHPPLGKTLIYMVFYFLTSLHIFWMSLYQIPKKHCVL